MDHTRFELVTPDCKSNMFPITPMAHNRRYATRTRDIKIRNLAFYPTELNVVIFMHEVGLEPTTS